MSQDNRSLFQTVRAWVAANYPGRLPRRLTIHTDCEEKISLPIPLPIVAAETPWNPSQLQTDILDALTGRALRKEALAEACEVEASELYRRASGGGDGPLPELVARGLVRHDRRVGYYRPDAPPENFSEP